MKIFRPLWRDGAFLVPQQFQQQARWDAHVADTVSRMALAHPWGVLRAEFDASALTLSRLNATRLIVRFADGTLIDTELADILPPVRDVSDVMQDSVEVLLALPLLSASGGNLDDGQESARPRRWRAELVTVQELVNLYGSRAVIVVICGNNAKLKESLENQCKGHPNVIIQGFTKKIPLYMDACDVLFSKPGGLTSTEAAVKGVPLIHTAPIPGCENRNAAFFARRGMSYYCQEPAQQAKYAKLLCENQFLRFRMAEAQRRNTNAGSAEEICGLLRQAVGSDEVTPCMF